MIHVIISPHPQEGEPAGTTPVEEETAGTPHPLEGEPAGTPHPEEGEPGGTPPPE